MDAMVRGMLAKARIADLEQEAGSERLSRLARSHRRAGTEPRRSRFLHGARRIVIAGTAVALALLSMRAMPAAALIPTGSSLVDPWPPLAAGLGHAVAAGWVCAGLPYPDVAAAGSADPPVAGSATCVGLACRWDLDDDRLDGALVPGAADACPGSTEPAPTVAVASGIACRGGLLLLDDTGRATWAGTWWRAGERELHLALAGWGSFQGLTFVGRWTDPGRAQGRIEGRVSEAPAILLAWPAPIL